MLTLQSPNQMYQSNERFNNQIKLISRSSANEKFIHKNSKIAQYITALFSMYYSLHVDVNMFINFTLTFIFAILAVLLQKWLLVLLFVPF